MINPTNEFWGLLGVGLMIFFFLLPLALSDKWKNKK